ncbi:DUF5994 family protein [Rhodococcus wratislaviensis]|uniref:DUF5994 family protein n=1 Tax=Rhodococcus wratislaviensis TaxID=44752 RepID=UPI001CECD154
MTRQAASRDRPRHQISAEHGQRLRLEPKDRCAGNIDGIWSPRTRTLSEELPELLAALTVRLGPIGRVVYDPAGWAAVPGRWVAAGYPGPARRVPLRAVRHDVCPRRRRQQDRPAGNTIERRCRLRASRV